MSHLCIGTFLGTARTFFDSHICIDSKSHAFIGKFLDHDALVLQLLGYGAL